ncbi:transcriptional regulator [Lentilactobacillus curieae]|uniref:Transcriptional regulator n=1 Tax=Lentilactobacillus curieae TaxID=1138822 RepID=A0A1S6QHN5_9LACO|nr:Rrf2 family transcriptional regulator [Lentilactobacillus curieae]AQW21127.1 transcriptional regulator [Lentilactobacillus curieae]
MANTQLSDATHILAYIALNQDKSEIKSSAIAESINTSPSLIRRMMSKLKNAGLINAVKGAATPSLAKNPGEISLLDVYLAISPDNSLLNVDEKTNSTCPVGSVIPNVLDHYYQEIQSTAEARMAKITLQEVLDDVCVIQKKTQTV